MLNAASIGYVLEHLSVFEGLLSRRISCKKQTQLKKNKLCFVPLVICFDFGWLTRQQNDLACSPLF